MIAELIHLKGVGRWTAEMLLIFCFHRKNVLSFGDYAIRKSLMQLHGLDEITLGHQAHFQKLYSPYASIASFYLWESLSLPALKPKKK